MNDLLDVTVIVEGKTELLFIKQLLAPYLARQSIFLTPTQISGGSDARGGDVRFSRTKKDIGNHLKQRQDTYVTLMVDYYAIGSDWPGLEDSQRQITHSQKADIINRETEKKVQELFPEQNKERRFIPYVSMHEIEALYFSNPEILADILNIKPTVIKSILQQCGEPEAINDNPQTAPSKRLKILCPDFKKTTTGITIAQMVNIAEMRKCCPLFNEWIATMEKLQR